MTCEHKPLPWWAIPAITMMSVTTATFVGCAVVGAIMEVKRQALMRRLAEIEAMDLIELPDGWVEVDDDD